MVQQLAAASEALLELPRSDSKADKDARKSQQRIVESMMSDIKLLKAQAELIEIGVDSDLKHSMSSRHAYGSQSRSMRFPDFRSF